MTGNPGTRVLLFVLMSCDYVAISAAGFGRAVAMAFAFQAAAYASYQGPREKNLSRAILLGHAFVVASGLTHPNGGMLGFIGFLFVAVYLDRTRLRRKHALVAGIPYLIGGAAWGIYILIDSEAFRSQYGYQTGWRFYGLSHPWKRSGGKSAGTFR